MSVLTLDAVEIAYNKQSVIEGVSLAIKDGEIACLLGPSGCGKTTLLRAIAGFKTLHAGSIKSAGQIISSPSIAVAPEKRQIGMVFQDFALFPHLNVGDNICFGLRHQNKTEKQKRLQELMLLIGLEGNESKYPHELSGGQQQRVALARAIAPKPQLLLLDEPFSSMDVELRSSLAKEVRAILKHEKITAVMVTHDQNEAFSMADKIAVLSQGRLLQWADAETLYHSPRNEFVARFVGLSDFLKGVIRGGKVETSLGSFNYKKNENQDLDHVAEGGQVKVLIRPEYIQLNAESESRAELISREFRGGYYMYYLRLPSGEEVQTLLPSLANYQLGESIGITLSIDEVSIFKSA